MKTVEYSRTAIKALKHMPSRDREAVMAKIASHAAGGMEDAIPLKGSTAWRLRHGDWRAIFDQSETTVTVLDVMHRREAYR